MRLVLRRRMAGREYEIEILPIGEGSLDDHVRKARRAAATPDLTVGVVLELHDNAASLRPTVIETLAALI